MWSPANFEIAKASGPISVTGYEYRELGLHLQGDGVWSLTHLSTGLKVCEIKGDVRTAFPVATEIAEAEDWGFISMVGYKDRFPDARQTLEEVLAKHRNATRQNRDLTEEERELIGPIAQQIAAKR